MLCFKKDPNQRPTARKLKSHAWLTPEGYTSTPSGASTLESSGAPSSGSEGAGAAGAAGGGGAGAGGTGTMVLNAGTGGMLVEVTSGRGALKMALPDHILPAPATISQLEQLRHLEHQRPQAARGAAPSGTVNWSGPQRPSLGSSPADEFRASTLHAGERDALVRLRPTEPPPPPPPPPPLTPRRSQNSVGVGHGLGGDDDTMSFMDSIISGISVDLPDGLGWPLECLPKCL
jgi:hypothetical protein